MTIGAWAPIAAVAATLLTACLSVGEHAVPDTAVASDYGRGNSQRNAPSDRLAGIDATANERDDKWWQEFRDEGLNRLVDRVLEVNTDLASAGLLLERARFVAGLAVDDRFPQFDANINTRSSKALVSDNLVSGTSSAVSVGLRYEVDLWNRLRKQHDASMWEAEATEEDLRATRLSLIGSALELYWTIAFLNHRISTGEESLERLERTLSLVKAQRTAGAVSRLEVQEAEQNLYGQRVAQSSLVQERVEARNALTVLLNGDPFPVDEEPQTLSDARSPNIDAGVPAELLGRRPDLRAAELRLRQFFVAVETTRASYYPAINLNGSVDGSSSSLQDVLSNPIATLGAGLVLPFLNWRQMKLNTQIARTDYEIAVNAFREALYAAFAEVDNALSARQELSMQIETSRLSFAAAREVERLYEVRYRAGATSLRIWLDAQEMRRTAELALAQAKLNRLLNDSALFRALGGGTR